MKDTTQYAALGFLSGVVSILLAIATFIDLSGRDYGGAPKTDGRKTS